MDIHKADVFNCGKENEIECVVKANYIKVS